MIQTFSEEDPATKELLPLYEESKRLQNSVAVLFKQLEDPKEEISLKMDNLLAQIISDTSTARASGKPATTPAPEELDNVISEKKRLDGLLQDLPDVADELALIAQFLRTGIDTLPD